MRKIVYATPGSMLAWRQNQGFFMGIEYVQNGSLMNPDGASTKLM